MKFGDVYDYRNAEEAKAFVGKKGAFNDCLLFIEKMPKQCELLILKEIAEKSTHPFTDGRGVISQFFRPILEEEALMTRRQLSEWLARGKGVYICDDSTMVGQKIVSTNYGYLEGQEDEPVEDYILIRRWRDTEWSKPTRAIYEEDKRRIEEA